MDQEKGDREPIMTTITADHTDELFECPHCKAHIEIRIHRDGFIEVIK